MKKEAVVRIAAAALVALSGITFVVSVHLSAAKPFVITVERNMTCGDGNVNGRLLIDGKEVARTLEPGLPGNRIPVGTFDAFIRADGKLGWRIELVKVPGWENTQIHLGNFPSETKGCILVGLDIQAGVDKNTKKATCAVTSSSGALSAIQSAMQKASDNGVSSDKLAISVTVR